MNWSMDYKGVILDMDGVIVDSNKYHLEAWKEFSKRHGLNLSDEDIRKDFGRTNRDIFNEMFGGKLSEEEIKTLDYEKEWLYRELYRKHITPAPGLLDFLADLKEKGVRIAIGSSAPQLNIEFVMDCLNLDHLIDDFAHSGMVKKGKPDPEIFLKAAEFIGISPEECVVFEDSIPGIKAGLAAGMKVIAVSTTHPKEELNMAHGVIQDFQGLDKNSMEKIVRIHNI